MLTKLVRSICDNQNVLVMRQHTKLVDNSWASPLSEWPLIAEVSVICRRTVG